MDRRGQVLVNVLITTVIVAVISAGLAQMMTQRYAANARATDGVVKQAAASAAMSQALQKWNSSAAASNICTQPTAAFSLTSGNAGTCSCEWTNATGISVNGTTYPVRVWVSGGAGAPPCPATTQMQACANDPGASFTAGAGCPK